MMATVGVTFSDSEEEPLRKNEEDEDLETTGGHRYKLRPRRKLFPQAIALRRYQPDSESEGSGEEFILYMDEDSEEDGSIASSECYEDGGTVRKSSYQGGRGPRADLKALSLVTNCPVSVKWLVDNFEYHLGKSLPRGFVYDQYVLLCDQHGLEPVNAASFGKLIRSVFPGLKTRRLGTRGNSKYHYNGVYLKNTSPLRTLFNAVRTQQGLMYDGGKRGRRVRKPVDHETLKELLGLDEADEIPPDVPPEEYLGKKPDMQKPFAELIIDPSKIPGNLDPKEFAIFEMMYHKHCKTIIECFESFDLRGVTEEWQRFWRIKCMEPVKPDKIVYKDVMSMATLFKVCTMESTDEFVKSMDLSTYQFAVDILFPCLSREMPVTMHQGMRNFIREVEIFMQKILNGYPLKMCQIKMRCLRTFVSLWHDYSRLNRQVKSAGQILRSNEILRGMRAELGKSINFDDIEEEEDQSVQLMPTTFSFIVKLVLDFNSQLKESEQSIDTWVHWVQMIVEKLVCESYRQINYGEVSNKPNAIEYWKAASDQVMGAIAKWGLMSVPHFKTFLNWCDHLMSHVYKIFTAHTEGFTLPSFYYFDYCLQPSTVTNIPRPLAMKVNGPGKNRKVSKRGVPLATSSINCPTQTICPVNSNTNFEIPAIRNQYPQVMSSTSESINQIRREESDSNDPPCELYLEDGLFLSSNLPIGLDLELFTDSELLSFLNEQQP